MFSCVIIAVAAIYRIVVWNLYDNPIGQEDFSVKLENLHQNLLNCTYLYAVTEFLLILRWLNFLEFFAGLGPLLIALRTLIADVFKFVMIVLLTCVMGAAIAVHSVVNTVRSQNETIIKYVEDEVLNETDVKSSKTIPEFFEDFRTCLINVIWSTFGLLEVPVSDL